MPQQEKNTVLTENQRSDRRLDIIATTLAALLAVIGVGGFCNYLYTIGISKVNQIHSLQRTADRVAAGEPRTRAKCTVSRVEPLQVFTINRHQSGINSNIETKECGTLSLDSQENAITAVADMQRKRTDYNKHLEALISVHQDIQEGKTYNFWVDDAKAQRPQIYRADEVK